jgi:hypothetical protein
MLLFILLSLIGIFALLLAFPHSEYAVIRRFINICPFLVLGALLVPWSFSDTVMLRWSPETLFPDPILFRTAPLAISFCVYLTVLWMLSEIIGGINKTNSISSRIFTVFFLGAGFLCFFAANALSILLSWILLDVLTFFLFLFLDIKNFEEEKRTTDFLSKSFGIFFINLLSNILIIIPALIGPQATQLDWSSVWANPPTSFGLSCFIIGIFLRLFLFPFFVSSSRFASGYTQIDIMVRLVYPATVLSLLSIAWPAAYLQPSGGLIFSILIILSFSIFLLASIGSLVSPSHRTFQNLYPLCISAIALFVSTQTPQSSNVFQGSAAILLIGGGIVLCVAPSRFSRVLSLLVYIPLVFCLLGFPFTPSEAIGSYLQKILHESDYLLFLPSIIGLVALSASIFRIPFRTQDRLKEPPGAIFIISILCALLSSVFFAYPGYHIPPLDVSVFLLPSILFTIGLLLGVYFPNKELFFFPEINLQYLFIDDDSLFYTIRKVFKTIFQLLENILNGEGALLWAFSILLLIWIVMRGN